MRNKRREKAEISLLPCLEKNISQRLDLKTLNALELEIKIGATNVERKMPFEHKLVIERKSWMSFLESEIYILHYNFCITRELFEPNWKIVFVLEILVV